jgi:hypothetical protein
LEEGSVLSELGGLLIPQEQWRLEDWGWVGTSKSDPTGNLHGAQEKEQVLWDHKALPCTRCVTPCE